MKSKHLPNRACLSAFILGTLGLLTAAVNARTFIGWNYQGVGGVGLELSDSAGAPGFEQIEWNNHLGIGQGPGPVPFENLYGSDSTQSTLDVISWTHSTANSWQHQQITGPDQILLNDFANTQPTITFDEIPYLEFGYTVVVYYGNNEGPSTSILTVGPQSRTITTGNTAESSYEAVGYLEATDFNGEAPTNYSVFRGLKDSSILISLTGNNNNGISAIQFVEELASDPPAPPTGPAPSNAAGSIAIDKTIDWQDSLRADQYDVYLWFSGDPQPATPTATVAASEYEPPLPLEPHRDYDWMVVARNSSSGESTPGPLWYFSTGADAIPFPAVNPSPFDGGTGVSTSVVFDWNDAELASKYHIYIWSPPEIQPTTPTATVTESQYAPPAALLNGTDYRWTVEAVNGSGMTPALDSVWSFSTANAPLGTPGNPMPSDMATDVSPITRLDWSDVPNATSYHVRIWYSDISRPLEPTAIVHTSDYQPTDVLEFSDQFSWDVEAVNDLGTTVGGPWQFGTAAVLPGPRRIGWNLVGMSGLGLQATNVAGAGSFAQVGWNNHPSVGQAPGETPFALVDDLGGDTSVAVTSWTQSSSNSWKHDHTSNPNEILTNDFADREPVLRFSEIPYPFYDVVVYYGNNEGPSTSVLEVNERSRTITTGNTATSSFRYLGFLEGTDANFDSPSNFAVFTHLSGTELVVALSGENNNGISAIQIIESGPPQADLVVTRFTIEGNTATFEFAGEPGVTTWKVMASKDLKTFPIDETANSVITEAAAGEYTATINIAATPQPYFFRIEN